MIRYYNCKDIDPNKIYEAFSVGFSDYIVKMEISKEDFFKLFFGPEGNDIKYSFIALDEDKPIGLILGGIKDYEGLKTIRCGALCVHPDYRGKGISHELFKLHKEAGINNNCKQMFLEVIGENHRAINFYENKGYEKVYELKYYTCKSLEKIGYKTNNGITINEIGMDNILDLGIRNVHINWQNDFDYMKKYGDVKYYGAYGNHKLIGAISINMNGRILLIWVDEEYRHRGIGKGLLSKAIKDLKLDRMSIAFPNNASLHGFVKKMDFQKEKLFQYEMYLTLD
ncbi:MAG: GNAT family N-acetyltransferase [Tissierellia bacterium]|nr:GNAT family N-acetyltransferase [Tissierellia bacterium]